MTAGGTTGARPWEGGGIYVIVLSNESHHCCDTCDMSLLALLVVVVMCMEGRDGCGPGQARQGGESTV